MHQNISINVGAGMHALLSTTGSFGALPVEFTSYSYV